MQEHTASSGISINVEQREGFVSESNEYAEFGPNYLRIQTDMPWDVYERTVDSLLTANDALPWWIGDALLFGERQWGDMYSQVIQEKYQREYQTLANYVYVCRAFDFSRRRENLSFTHHAEMAKLPDAQRIQLMEEAEPNPGDKRPKLSTRDVREKVRELTTTEEPESFLDTPTSKRPEQDNHPAARKYTILKYDNFGVVEDWQLDSFLEKLDAMDEDERSEALMRIRPRPGRSREDEKLLRWLAGFTPSEQSDNGEPTIASGFEPCSHCGGTGKRKYHINDGGEVIYE